MIAFDEERHVEVASGVVFAAAATTLSTSSVPTEFAKPYNIALRKVSAAHGTRCLRRRVAVRKTASFSMAAVLLYAHFHGLPLQPQTTLERTERSAAVHGFAKVRR